MDKFLPLKMSMNIHEQRLLAYFPSSGSNAQSAVSVLCISLHGKAFLLYRFCWCKEALSLDGGFLLQFDLTIPVAAITIQKQSRVHTELNYSWLHLYCHTLGLPH